MTADANYREAFSTDGVRLCVRTAGRPDSRPIIFLHGFSQSHLTWERQFGGSLAREFELVAFDLRGHGWSDKPNTVEAYQTSRLWADDLAAVVALLAPRRPVLVAWSYGGRVVCDYLATYGHRAVAGINFVAGVVSDEGEHFGADIRLVGRTANADPSKSIAATREFLAACFAKRPPQDDFETMLAYNAMVPPSVRLKLLGRSLDARSVLSAVDVPVLFSHGTADRIVAPGMSTFGSALIADSPVSWYENVGHSPFYEAAERFDRELAEFARRCS